ISQSAMFVVCIAMLVQFLVQELQKTRFDMAAVWGLLAILFLANILFIATSRTALVVLPIIFLLLGFRQFGLRGALGLIVVLGVVIAAAWPTSDYLRTRASNLLSEIRNYQSSDTRTSAGERIEFWRKSVRIIGDAPVIGHGTGTISDQFRQLAAPGSG